MRWVIILFWIGAVLAVDALIGLLGLRFWQRVAPKFPVERIARIEGTLALGLMLAYFLLK